MRREHVEKGKRLSGLETGNPAHYIDVQCSSSQTRDSSSVVIAWQPCVAQTKNVHFGDSFIAWRILWIPGIRTQSCNHIMISWLLCVHATSVRVKNVGLFRTITHLHVHCTCMYVLVLQQNICVFTWDFDFNDVGLEFFCVSFVECL